MLAKGAKEGGGSSPTKLVSARRALGLGLKRISVMGSREPLPQSNGSFRLHPSEPRQKGACLVFCGACAIAGICWRLAFSHRPSPEYYRAAAATQTATTASKTRTVVDRQGRLESLEK